MSFFGNSKLKPIDYVSLSKRKYHSSTLTTSIASSNIVKTNNKASTEYSKSVKNTSDEVSGKISAKNEPQDNEPNYGVISIDQTSPSIKKTYE